MMNLNKFFKKIDCWKMGQCNHPQICIYKFNKMCLISKHRGISNKDNPLGGI